MLYRPFAEHLDKVAPEDLVRLTGVHEGWYVEYKREMVGNREIAKSLSSFANQYGGWLFFGVEEDSASNAAASFPGILNSELQVALDSIRNASKDLLNPPVFYNIKVFEGPVAQLQLPAGRSIVVVQIPEGPNSPYVHNDGRIYRRVGDSSQPTPVTDRATFDLLAQRGEEARNRLSDRVLWSPQTSQGEENQPYIHISIMSDPFETMGHWYSGRITDFAQTMRGSLLPFDNIYSMENGYIARQTINNDAYMRLFTWQFSRQCHSFVTVPIQVRVPNIADPSWAGYITGKDFVSRIIKSGMESARILDLNVMMYLFLAIMARHRTLVGESGINGPFYLKANIENAWRTVPFVDHSKYYEHICSFGLPLNQFSEMVVPEGTSLESFIVSPELSERPLESAPSADVGATSLSLDVLNALGVPEEVLAESVKELEEMGNRSQQIRRPI